MRTSGSFPLSLVVFIREDNEKLTTPGRKLVIFPSLRANEYAVLRSLKICSCFSRASKSTPCIGPFMLGVAVISLRSSLWQIKFVLKLY